MQRISKVLQEATPPAVVAAAGVAPALSPPSSVSSESVDPFACLLSPLGAQQAKLSLSMDSGLVTLVEDCTVCPLVQKSVAQPLARLAWRALQGSVAAPPFSVGMAMHVCATYWNPRQSTWEPFMEEWHVNIEVRCCCCKDDFLA